MVIFVLLGAILFYLFIYAVLTHYAKGTVLFDWALSPSPPFPVFLSTSAAAQALEWLMVVGLAYLALDYLLSLLRARGNAGTSSN